MFNNPGAIIKRLAEILFWIETIGGMISGIIFTVVNASLLPFLIGLFSFIPAYIQALLLYGFGSLIDDTQACRETNKEILCTLQSNTPETDHNQSVNTIKIIQPNSNKTWLCECGNRVDITATECPKCNAPRPSVLDNKI